MIFSNKRHEVTQRQSFRRWEEPAPGRTQRAQGMEHPGSSCGNVWPLICKCSQHLKKTIPKGGVIFGREEEAGKLLTAVHSPGAGPQWQLEPQTRLYCCRAAQRSWPGTPPGPVDIIHRAMAEGQAGHLVLEMNKQANKKLCSS